MKMNKNSRLYTVARANNILLDGNIKYLSVILVGPYYAGAQEEQFAWSRKKLLFLMYSKKNETCEVNSI